MSIANVSERGQWIQTFTGIRFWPLEPKAADVRLEDIAHALAMKCRYGGHCQQFYSVAEHSILVCDMVPEPLKVHALMHDSWEAYTFDAAAPIKDAIILQLPEPRLTMMSAHEDTGLGVIAEAFDLGALSEEEEAAVFRADKMALAMEAPQLMAPLDPGWSAWLPEVEPGEVRKVQCMDWREAKAAFLYYAYMLGIADN